MSRCSISRSLGLRVPVAVRPTVTTRSTSRSSRHSRRIPCPTIPVAPKISTFMTSSHLLCSEYAPGQPAQSFEENAPQEQRQVFVVNQTYRGINMKIIKTALALAILSTSFSGGLALAQEHHDNDAQQHHDNDRDNHKYVKHDDWKKGGRIKNEDWDRGEHVDYKQNHLNAPPRGHEIGRASCRERV